MFSSQNKTTTNNNGFMQILSVLLAQFALLHISELSFTPDNKLNKHNCDLFLQQNCVFIHFFYFIFFLRISRTSEAAVYLVSECGAVIICALFFQLDATCSTLHNFFVLPSCKDHSGSHYATFYLPVLI